MFSFIKQNYHQQICGHRHYSLYLLITVAFLLLGCTNATNNTTDTGEGFVDTLKSYANLALEKIRGRTEDNSTTMANETIDHNETSIFHKPKNINDVQLILLAILRLLAQAFLVVS